MSKTTATWTIVSIRDVGTTARFQIVETGLSTTFMEMKCAMGWAMLPAVKEAELLVSVTVVERMGAARRVIPIYRPPVAHRSVADDRPVSLAQPCGRFSSRQSTRDRHRK
jgi:hypothetical protein